MTHHTAKFPDKNTPPRSLARGTFPLTSTTAPLPGAAGPLGPAVAVAYVAARAPLLVLGVPSLADSPAEAIDGRTLWYLLRKNLARQ